MTTLRTADCRLPIADLPAWERGPAPPRQPPGPRLPIGDRKSEIGNHALAAALAVLLLGARLVAAGEVSGAEEGYWVLKFTNETPKPFPFESIPGKVTYYWYMVYRVENPTHQPVPCELSFTLDLSLQKVKDTYPDVADPIAERELEKKVLERPVLNSTEIHKAPIKPGETREGIAIFRVGSAAADFDRMVIAVNGLARRRYLGREGEASVRRFRDRVLLLRYQYLPSRWTTGKDLRLEDEAWSLIESDTPDRTSTDVEKADETRKKLDELYKAMEEEKKRVPPSEGPKPPASSAGAPAETVAIAPSAGAKLLAGLHALADQSKAVRAAFTETLGPEGQRRTATGTLSLGPAGKFAVERLISLGTGPSLKEIRVFDGESLWAHTTAKDVGDIVRRWVVATTKKEWHALDGRPEVDFATVANPARAWRLFGDALVYLGREQMEREAAAVFEVRPDARFAPLLAGPLVSDLLGFSAVKRVRFWVGEKTAFQLKMQVYDDQGAVLGSLQCTEVEPDAQVDPRRFAFRPPAGADVTDMNAATAARDKP